MLSRTQAGPGGTVKQEQEEIFLQPRTSLLADLCTISIKYDVEEMSAASEGPEGIFSVLLYQCTINIRLIFQSFLGPPMSGRLLRNAAHHMIRNLEREYPLQLLQTQ